MWSIIQEIREKINDLAKSDGWFTALVLALVAVASFGLGRQSVDREMASKPAATAAPIEPVAEVSGISTTSVTGTFYVASKKGSAYHLPHCSGAKSIAEANKITFASKAEAEAAGYRPAANCKGI